MDKVKETVGLGVLGKGWVKGSFYSFLLFIDLSGLRVPFLQSWSFRVWNERLLELFFFPCSIIQPGRMLNGSWFIVVRTEP